MNASSESSATMQIKIRTMDSQDYPFSITPNTTIQELKSKIQQVF